MSDPSKQTFSEDVPYDLMEWYSASQNLPLLDDINEFVEKQRDSEKIDWNAVAKYTSGISNARECQMIWQHLAYGAPFLDNIEDGAEPLDDDSDLGTGTILYPASSSEELAKAKEAAEILLAFASETNTMTEKVLNEKKATEEEDEENMTNAGSKSPVREEGPREHWKGYLEGDKKQVSSHAAAASSAIEKDEVFASLSEDLDDKTPSVSPSETNSSSDSDHYELSKYRSSQILTLLDEIIEFLKTHDNGGKIDWHAMVKNTSTGISNARECQMIWQHLAYGAPLLENIEDGAEPLDDDSDLETEPDLEAFERANESLKIFPSSGPASSITETMAMLEIDQMEKKATEEDQDNVTDTGSRSLVNEKSHVVASFANDGPGEHFKGDLKGVGNRASSSVAAAASASLANDGDEIVASSSSLSEDGEDKAPAGSSSETVMIDTVAGSETDPSEEETKEEEKEPTD